MTTGRDREAEKVADRAASAAVERRRREAWNSRECQAVYSRLISAGGGHTAVHPTMQARARDLAINCALRGVEPDLAAFVAATKRANAACGEAHARRVVRERAEAARRRP